MSNDQPYPDYLLRNGCRIANPAQSFQTLTVGAVNIDEYEDDDFHSVNSDGMPATYSASGFGIWGSIKPEVVVPVGDLVFSKALPLVARIDESTSASLICSTLHGAPLTERDGIGTSYAAPVAASISTELQEVYPTISALARKAIIVSASSWPEWVSEDKRELAIRTIGYGIVDPEKALENDEHRVCLISDGSLTIRQKQTHLYKVAIPEDIRSEEIDSIVRVSVTLCYSAQPRRTRSTLKRYYSSWLDWRSSRKSESFESFASATCKDADQNISPTDDGAFPWVIGSASNYGVTGVTRSNSACQKDWFDIPGHDLPDEFGIAVTSHQGWDTNLKSECKYSLVVAFESLDQQMPIYTPISLAIDELIQELQPQVTV